jgi:hypothetical protein
MKQPFNMKNTLLIPVSLTCATALATFLTTSSVYAQDVTFGSAQSITGDANLIDAASTAGIINIDAILLNGNYNSPAIGNNGSGNATPTSLTADGVTFNAATPTTTSASDGVISVTGSSGTFFSYGNNTAFSGGSAAFNSVMNAGGLYIDSASGAGVISIASSALTVGDIYDVQIFNYSGDGQNESTTFTSGSSSVSLFDSNGGANVGQFVTGVFTATGANENIDYSYGSGAFTPVIGAISVVEVAPAPEPSTSALVLSGMLLVGLGLRHRRQAVV